MNARTLDPLLGTPARLAIVATLADGSDLTFTELKSATGLADGNLHVQTGQLTAAGYLRLRREKRGGRTVTCFHLEDEGLAALRRLSDRLLQAISGVRPMRMERTDRDQSRVW